MEFGEILKQISLGDVGFAGLVTLAIYLILTGRLVPKSTVEDIRASYEKSSASDRETSTQWRQAYETSEAARKEIDKQMDLLIEYARTSDHMIRSIQERASRPSESVQK